MTTKELNLIEEMVEIIIGRKAGTINEIYADERLREIKKLLTDKKND